MDTEKFKKILRKGESSVLDFKSEQYRLIGDKSGEKTAEFIKDIISFTNTIRDEPAYIIIGIEELKDGSKRLLGLNKNIDDAIFQQKIKDKVNPKPIFSYSVIQYKKINFGIIEIPINYYTEPITPLKKIKGLDPGTVYFRRGTSNSEATVNEIIKINDWFRSLRPSEIKNEYLDELTNILSNLNETEVKLAPIATEILSIAKKLNNPTIINLFKSEITGWDRDNIENYPQEFFNYRREKVVVSPILIKSITTNSTNSARKVYNNLKNSDDSDEMNIFFNHPIAFIDSEISRIKTNGLDNLYFEKRNMKELLPDKNITGELCFYYIFDTYNSLVQKIRYKYIEVLMTLIK